MARVVRCAVTETKNAYGDMPTRIEDLASLAERLDDVRQANVDHHLELVAAAARAGVKMLGMGELFPGPYFALGREPIWRELAEDAEEGPTITAMRAAAREHAMLLVCPIYELDAASGKRFNTAVVVGETGTVIGKYKKTHIPEGTNERASFCETFYYERSDGALGDSPVNVSQTAHFPVFDTSFARIGVSICYDRHFPGSIASLAAAGAEVVFSPAVTFGAKSQRLWELEFDVDAMRHRLFIGGSNRRGAEPPWNVEFFGASHFVGPNGRVDPIDVHPNLIVADLDLDQLAGDDPSGWGLARDTRPDIYG